MSQESSSIGGVGVGVVGVELDLHRDARGTTMGDALGLGVRNLP